MKKLPQLRDSKNRPFQLERELASGGEGAVYLVQNDTARVAKVYHKPPSAQTVEKLTAMVRLSNAKLAAVAAWPGELLFGPDGKQLVGFAMPKLSAFQPIQHLYNPVMRLKFYPQAGWNFQLRAALNAAAAFDEVHRAGCIVGDVNQSNVQVSSQALVRLIDCDSFQVKANGKQYLCEVGVPHYTAPELQGRSFRGVMRSENHDNFGLAVLIYQLLFVGRHPYAGVYRGKGDLSFEEMISQFRFAQGPVAHTWQMEPPPHTPTFADIPPQLGILFRRAFEKGSETGTRPTPSKWIAVLTELEKYTVECNRDPGHYYFKNSSSCCWCRIVEKGGPDYYFGVASGANAFEVNEQKLQELLSRLKNCPFTIFEYDANRYFPRTIPKPEPVPEGLDEHRTMTTVLKVVVGVSALMIPLGSMSKFFALIGILASVVFGIWLLFLIYSSPWRKEYDRRRREKRVIQSELDDYEDDWQRITQEYRHAYERADKAISDGATTCRELTSKYHAELAKSAGSAKAKAFERHLRLHAILDATIPSLGAGRKNTLAANGIMTALDVDWNRVRSISGFGDALTTNICAWRSRVEAAFSFDPLTAVSPSENLTISMRYRATQKQLLEDLDRQLLKIELLAPTVQSKLAKLEPDIRRVMVDFAKVQIDLQHFLNS